VVAQLVKFTYCWKHQT